MYGKRGRIGLIVPSTNAVTEMEAYQILPHDVSVHFTRIPYAGTGTEEADSKMLDCVEDCAILLAGTSQTVGVNVVGFAHGSASAKGMGFDKSLAERLFKATKVPAITMSTAVVEALKKLGAKSLSIGSPLDQPSMLERIRLFLEYNGFSVKTVRSLTLQSHNEVSSQTPDTAYGLLKSMDRNDIEAIVINNANMRTIEVLQRVEEDTGKAVITGNQALMWACLRTIGVNDRIRDLGRLFLL